MHHQQFMKNTNQKLMTRRSFARTTALTSIGVMAAGNIFGQGADKKGIGPVLGHIDENRIFTFVRAPREGKIELIVTGGDSQEVARLYGIAETENDLCVQFEVSDLEPDTVYTGNFLDSKGKPLFEGAVFSARTPAKTKDIERVVLGMGSCVSSDKFDRIWGQIAAEKIEGFCLLGDTPYIDSNDLAKNRARRREF